mmetsp:Transcript_10321/g.26244  ORF Transcript_10321/g.26244 Transcript_10321/m.26244 type:complete len:266 (-) Transcript_10321:628-1425(-)
MWRRSRPVPGGHRDKPRVRKRLLSVHPLGRVLLEQGRDEALGIRRHQAPRLPLKRVLAVHRGQGDLPIGLAPERQLPRQQHERDRPDTPHIDTLAVRHVAQDLRGGVRDGSQRILHVGACDGAQPEVRDLHELDIAQGVPRLGDQHVLGLEVTVGDAVLVQAPHPQDQLAGHSLCDGLGEPPARELEQQLEQVAPVHFLHDQKNRHRRFKQVNQTNHVRVASNQLEDGNLRADVLPVLGFQRAGLLGNHLDRHLRTGGSAAPLED